MTPAEHLTEAERLLQVAEADEQAMGPRSSDGRVQRAIAHSLIAAAAELGVPHNEATTGGGPGAPQAQGS